MPQHLTPEQLDLLLPQTQCGLCGHKGCLPYAEAMMYEQAPINLCPPGGVKTLLALGERLEQDPTPYIADMEKSAKPKVVAVIREAECIGCTKCIQVCPVDAILGSAKKMHSVITSECTGCELCIAPCPVDCIDLTPLSSEDSVQNEYDKANHARIRYQHRLKRLARENESNRMRRIEKTKKDKNSYVEAAIARAKAKKLPHPLPTNQPTTD